MVIDGRPSEGGGNLMGYANFAVHEHAKTRPSATTRRGRRRTGRLSTFVRVYATETIGEGREIRIDYDMGNMEERSFYTYLTEVVGVPDESLGSGDYKANVWATPRSLKA